MEPAIGVQEVEVAADDDRQSVVSAATTVFLGLEDPVAAELRQLRKDLTMARKELLKQFEEATNSNVPMEERADDFQTVDDMRLQYGTLLIGFVERARALLTPLTRGSRVRLNQVATAVDRARTAWTSTRYLDNDVPIPERELHIPTREEILDMSAAGSGRRPSSHQSDAPPAAPPQIRTSSPINDVQRGANPSGTVGPATNDPNLLAPPLLRYCYPRPRGTYGDRDGRPSPFSQLLDDGGSFR